MKVSPMATCAGRNASIPDPSSSIIVGSKAPSPSRRRDCHLMAPPCTFVRCFNSDKHWGVIKMTVSPTATLAAELRLGLVAE